MARGLGLTELVVIILIMILLFGGKKVKTLARQTGEAARELKKITKEYEGKPTEPTTPLRRKRKIENIEKKGGSENA